jgi:quinol monooxygenase YgiN
MENTKLTVLARITAKSGKETQLKQELQNLTSRSRSEDGCITFDLHQCVDNEAQFLFYENWASREALNKHLETPHVKNFLNQADELLAEPIQATFWQQIG